MTIDRHAALRARYRPPSQLVADKSIDHIDAGAAGFIARSPLFVFATTGADGTDASPRGGPPGFVRVLDRHRLAFADLSGNNRLDSCTNLLERPNVGLLVIVPGVQLGMDPLLIEADLEAGYAATLWQPGGADDAAG